MAHADRNLDYDITIKSGDKEINMLPFVKELMGNSIIGMAKALKGYDENGDLEIKITRKNPEQE